MADRKILIRDMKHPRKKKGNDVWAAQYWGYEADTLAKKADNGDVRVPYFRLDESQKAARLLMLSDIATVMEERHRAACQAFADTSKLRCRDERFVGARVELVTDLHLAAVEWVLENGFDTARTTGLDLSRDCAAPLTTYRVAKENTDGITTDG